MTRGNEGRERDKENCWDLLDLAKAEGKPNLKLPNYMKHFILLFFK